MEPGNSRTSLTEAAFFSALTVIFCFLGSYLPLSGMIINFIIPVPIIILTLRNGLRLGMISTIVASFLVGILIDPFQMVSVILGFGFLGIAIGGALREGFSPGKVMVLGSVVSLISKILLVLVFAWIFKVSLFTDSDMVLDKAITKIEEIYNAKGFREEDIKLAIANLKTMIHYMIVLFPVTLIIFSVIDTFINFNVARLVATKLGTKIPGLPCFTEWRFPWQIIWGYILGLVLCTIGRFSGIETLSVIGLNIYYFFGFFFILQGAAVGWCGLNVWKAQPPLKWLALLLIAILLPILQLLHWVGILDLWLDLRRFLRKKEDGGERV